MGLFDEFVEDLRIEKIKNPTRVFISEQDKDERQKLIANCRDRVYESERLIELNQPFELGGAL
jgi:hypothetical protein